MRTFALALGAAALLASSSAALAGESSNELGRCIVVHMNPQDQEDLVRWIFGAMALHPNIKPLSNITPAQQETFSRTAAALIERLLTVDCRTQSQIAIKAEGPQALEIAFKQAGEVAMRSLLSNPDVTAHLAALDKYVNIEKIKALSSQK